MKWLGPRHMENQQSLSNTSSHRMQAASRSSRALPADLDYMNITTLSMESREKLTKVRAQIVAVCKLTSRHLTPDGKLSRVAPDSPETQYQQTYAGHAAAETLPLSYHVQVRPTDIGQASRIGGVNPADIDSLLIHLEVQRRSRVRCNPELDLVLTLGASPVITSAMPALLLYADPPACCTVALQPARQGKYV